MPYAKPLTAWQRAAALATEGACLLPYLLAALGSFIKLNRPPQYLSAVPALWQPILLTAAAALLHGALRAPLRLWRAAYYVRLCTDESSLPSLRLPRQALYAIGWQWRLWGHRIIALTLACAPAALLLARGSLASTQNASMQPVLWLTAGGVVLLGGIVAVAVWQCRYALAPLYLLRGYPAAAAMALSPRAMRGHLREYVNFLGGELPRLCLCVLLVPAIWIIPAFRRRRIALLLSFMPSEA